MLPLEKVSSGTARKADTGKTAWRYERRRPVYTLLYQFVSDPYPAGAVRVSPEIGVLNCPCDRVTHGLRY